MAHRTGRPRVSSSLRHCLLLRLSALDLLLRELRVVPGHLLRILSACVHLLLLERMLMLLLLLLELLLLVLVLLRLLMLRGYRLLLSVPGALLLNGDLALATCQLVGIGSERKNR